MILSRSLARRRIAAGVRPGWLAAWVPVAADAILLAPVLWLVWRGISTLTASVSNGPLLAGIALFICAFLPMQVVLGLSALWATKSRWQDDPSAPH